MDCWTVFTLARDYGYFYFGLKVDWYGLSLIYQYFILD